MKPHTFFVLGRVSNLPTVWTNLVAAAILGGAAHTDLSTELNTASIFSWPFGSVQFSAFALLLLAGSLFYLSGMFLNDAFDAQWDKANNNPRPIPLGQVNRHTVLYWGWAMLGAGWVSLGLLLAAFPTVNPIEVFLCAGLLSACIVAYDLWHKQSAHSVVLMGLCRGSLYALAAASFSVLHPTVFAAAASLVLYIAGLTYFARSEHRNRIGHQWPLLLLATPLAIALYLSKNLLITGPFALLFLIWVGSRIKPLLFSQSPNIRTCIGGLLAAIPLIDALFLSAVNAWFEACLCVAVFICIPRLHRWVSGT